MRDFLKLIACILFCQSAGLIGVIFTAPAIPAWYAFLNKPAFNPPNGIFGPVWTLLYTLMGISLYWIWSKGTGHPGRRTALVVFTIQWLLNALWTPLFFGLQLPLWAFFEILLLWIFILGTMRTFYPISRAASLLLIPYFLWVSFAAFLNYHLWHLNR